MTDVQRRASLAVRALRRVAHPRRRAGGPDGWGRLPSSSGRANTGCSKPGTVGRTDPR